MLSLGAQVDDVQFLPSILGIFATTLFTIYLTTIVNDVRKEISYFCTCITLQFILLNALTFFDMPLYPRISNLLYRWFCILLLYSTLLWGQSAYAQYTLNKPMTRSPGDEIHNTYPTTVFSLIRGLCLYKAALSVGYAFPFNLYPSGSWNYWIDGIGTVGVFILIGALQNRMWEHNHRYMHGGGNYWSFDSVFPPRSISPTLHYPYITGTEVRIHCGQEQYQERIYESNFDLSYEF